MKDMTIRQMIEAIQANPLTEFVYQVDGSLFVIYDALDGRHDIDPIGSLDEAPNAIRVNLVD